MNSTPATIIALFITLQACAAAPVHQSDKADTKSEATIVPAGSATKIQSDLTELNLNMPYDDNCDCGSEKATNHTVFDRGYQALLDGDYDKAMQHFQHFQNLASSLTEELEAKIAIAYVRILPSSSHYDPEKAWKAYGSILKKDVKNMDIHLSTRIIFQSLQNMLDLHIEEGRLRSSNTLLQANINKHEKALDRLRELTVGRSRNSTQ